MDMAGEEEVAFSQILFEKKTLLHFRETVLSFSLFFLSIGKWLVPPEPARPRSIGQRMRDALPHQVRGTVVEITSELVYGYYRLIRSQVV